jgi:integrase
MPKTAEKPTKPHPDFPLFPHATRRWAKKVRGKLHYFGRWDDPQAALQKWLDSKDDLLGGRAPRSRDGLTLRDLANHFLTAKRHLLDSRELAQRTWDDYHATCERVIKQFGATRLVDDLRPTDFISLRASIAKNWGPVAVGNEVQRVRVLFKYGFDAELLDKTVRFGPLFKRPSKKTLRQARHAKGLRMFEAEQIRALLDIASVPMKAMLLLGINAGFGNSDVGALTMKAVDLKGGWLSFPRPKTGIMRRCPLWTETATALQAAIKARPSPIDEAHVDLVFVTRHGRPWGKDVADSPVSKELAKMLKRLSMARPGLNFYALRHTFETIAGETKDQPAVSAVMGHAPAANDMSATYREKISDDRLKAVTEHVRKWLFAKAVANKTRNAHGKSRE